MYLDPKLMDKIIKVALDEDLGEVGDITTKAVFPEPQRSKGIILCKDSGIIAGMEIAARVFTLLDNSIIFNPRVDDGEKVQPEQVLATVEGFTQSILTGERTALNFLQHLSGIATLTHKFVERVKSYPVKIMDTRKTLPGLRAFEKYAVQVGGGFNHRLGLYDGVLIKDNHIRAAGGIAQAIKTARLHLSNEVKIEVEAETLEQVKEAIEAGADVIMLDNMDINTMLEAVKLVNKRALVEASGGVTLENVVKMAKTGVDWISVGVLTQAAPSLDISLEILLMSISDER
ncbi:MAG: carboxylating nicotinate-nucleotide diphosphorylase [Actinomycetota bacterium]|nr:carboxylating nicotinate-nucleotide diphosphorylase [Actinomycetota bacterium]